MTSTSNSGEQGTTQAYCANSGYPVGAVNRAIADALEAGELREVEGGYVVAEEVYEGLLIRFTDVY